MYSQGIFKFNTPEDRKQFIVICGLQLISGASRGYEQVVNYHYDRFKAVHPNANDMFFNPLISWRNKYKNGDPAQGPKFPFSTTALVWTTDFKHLMDMTSDVPNYICIILPMTIPHAHMKFKHLLFRGLAIGTCRAIGFNTVYSIIYK